MEWTESRRSTKIIFRDKTEHAQAGNFLVNTFDRSRAGRSARKTVTLTAVRTLASAAGTQKALIYRRVLNISLMREHAKKSFPIRNVLKEEHTY